MASTHLLTSSYSASAPRPRRIGLSRYTKERPLRRRSFAAQPSCQVSLFEALRPQPAMVTDVDDLAVRTLELLLEVGASPGHLPESPGPLLCQLAIDRL